ncbi:MlaD family protein [Rubritalea marina]|uniref:MlaD family protein n=1 Tax=Rubritalea marina TaxID=361055 RepID=UPI0003630545|nr:MlaD family protein [Rubritalea marina]
MQLKEKRPETLAGLFVFVGILVLALLIVQFGKIKQQFSDDYHIYVEFENASGLIKGSEVRLGGAKVGRVTQVPELTDNLSVRVDLAIDERVPIYRGSEFQIQSLSLLGDKMVVIVPPSTRSDAARLVDGDMAQGVETAGLQGLQSDASGVARNAQRVLSRMDERLADVEEMLADFRVTLDRVNNGVLSDQNIQAFEGTMANIEETTSRFAKASQDLETGLKELPSTISAVRAVAERGDSTFQSLQEKMDKIDPVLDELPSTVRSYRELGKKLSQLTDSANTTIKSMKQGQGLLGALLYDEQVSQDTKDFIQNLKKHGLLGYKDEDSSKPYDAKDSRFRGIRRD